MYMHNRRGVWRPTTKPRKIFVLMDFLERLKEKNKTVYRKNKHPIETSQAKECATCTKNFGQ